MRDHLRSFVEGLQETVEGQLQHLSDRRTAIARQEGAARRTYLKDLRRRVHAVISRERLNDLQKDRTTAERRGSGMAARAGAYAGRRRAAKRHRASGSQGEEAAQGRPPLRRSRPGPAKREVEISVVLRSGAVSLAISLTVDGLLGKLGRSAAGFIFETGSVTGVAYRWRGRRRFNADRETQHSIVGTQQRQIELTLPVELAVLEGVPCQVGCAMASCQRSCCCRDLVGIVPVFEALWDRLSLGLENVGAIGDSPKPMTHSVSFRRRNGASSVARLCRRPLDPRSREVEADIGSRGLEASARIRREHDGGCRASPGLVGRARGPVRQSGGPPLERRGDPRRDAFMRGLASQAIAAPFEADGSRADLLSVAPWRDAQPELARLYDQFASWERSRKRWPGRGSIGTGLDASRRASV